MRGLRLHQRPTARAVALFEGLNLVMVVLFAAVQFLYGPSDLARGMRLPAVAAFAVGAIVAYGFLLAMLRPGRRTRGEIALLVVAGAVVAWAVAEYLLAFLALALIPIAARYWLSLPRTLWLSLGLILWSTLWTVATRGDATEPGASVVLGLVFFGVSFVFGGYTLLSFEFAVREARAREALAGDLRRRERLRALELENAALAVRHAVAQELHDTLGHHLTAQGFDLQVVERLAGHGSDARAAAGLDRARDRNASAMHDLRRAVRTLRASEPGARDAPASEAAPAGSPEGEPAQAALAADLATLVDVDGFEARLSVSGRERPLAPEVRDTVRAVAREAVTNAMKHAPDAPLALRLAFDGDAVAIRASNPVAAGSTPGHDGEGARGVGLAGLRERIEGLGGTFRAGREGGEFVVSARVAAGGDS